VLIKEVRGDVEIDPDHNDVLSMCLELHGKSMQEAAEWVLERTGEPIKVSEIAAMLIRAGHTPETELKKLENSLYITMKRKDEFFQMENGEWGLTEWDR
jgi:DNA-directed RNA polymerase delta subunit